MIFYTFCQLVGLSSEKELYNIFPFGWKQKAEPWKYKSKSRRPHMFVENLHLYGPSIIIPNKPLFLTLILICSQIKIYMEIT